jgi:hypothetical protein
MNFDNLKKLADFVSTIPQEQFDMSILRDLRDNFSDKHCNTVGCVVGHMMSIIPDGEIIYYNHTDRINFFLTARRWLDITSGQSVSLFLFSHLWEKTDNTVNGAVNRIKYLIKYKQLPSNWQDQLEGITPLTYNENY